MIKTNLYVMTTVLAGTLSLASAAAQNNANIGRLDVANEVYGKPVMSSDNQKVGNLNNLVIDLESGRILYGTVATSKGTVGVAPEVFAQTPGPKENSVKANVTKQKLEGAPQFKDNNTPEGLGQASYISQVYQYFGQSPWWQGSQPANVGAFHNVHKASQALGMTIENVNNQPIGKVNNIVVDLPAGRIAYVVITPDSSLGLGNNLYALPPEALTLSSDHKNLVSNIDKTKLASAPHFATNKWPNVSDRTFASQVYQYFGKQPYFSAQPTGR